MRQVRVLPLGLCLVLLTLGACGIKGEPGTPAAAVAGTSGGEG
jgi:predicted small lipoprotein YifL